MSGNLEVDIVDVHVRPRLCNSCVSNGWKCPCSLAEAFQGTRTPRICLVLLRTRLTVDVGIATGLKQSTLGHPVLLHGAPPWLVLAERKTLTEPPNIPMT